ncbi:Dek [Carabus blaptoides fortunei]
MSYAVSEVEEKPNLDSTDSSQDSQDAVKSETDETPEKKVGGEVKTKEKSPEPATKTEEKPEVNNDNAKENEKVDGEEVKNDKNDDSKSKVKDEKNSKEEKSEDKTDDDTEGAEDASEDGEEDEDDDKKEVPLLDQPLEQSGTRERKKVQRFNEDMTPESKEVWSLTPAKVDIPSGSGSQLGNIPRIDASISRFKTDDLKLLHRVLFKTPGKTIQIKKNIRKFNGFDFKKDSDAYAKKLSGIQKMEMKQLKSICEMLDLDKKGNKDDIGDRICEFLLEPKDSGKAVSSGGRPKRTAAVRANNRGYSSPEDDDESDGGARRSSRAKRGKGKRTNLKDESSSESDAEFNPSDSEEEEERPRVTKKRNVRTTRKKQETDDEASDLEETPPSSDESEVHAVQEPKSKRKRGSVGKVPNNKVKKASPKNAKPTPKKAANSAAANKNKKPETKKGRKRGKEESEDEDDDDEEGEERDSENNEVSSSEDEPLVKKSKSPQPPSDDEIKTYVKEILEGANLEEITMKTVCKQVYAHYPEFDLAHKKDFIKTTVKSLIST